MRPLGRSLGWWVFTALGLLNAALLLGALVDHFGQEPPLARAVFLAYGVGLGFTAETLERRGMFG